MALKRIRYDTGENIMKVRIEDETRRTIDTWTLMMSDFPEWVDLIRNKFGINHKKKSKDLDWIR